MSINRKKKAKYKVQNSKRREVAFSSFNLMVFFLVGLFLFLVAYVDGEHLWRFLHNVFLGLFGLLATVIGPVYIFMAIFYSIKNERPLFKSKIYEIFALLLILCAIVQIYDGSAANNVVKGSGFFERLDNLKVAWNFGLKHVGGGAVGEFLNLICSYFFGRTVAFLIFLVLFFALFFLTLGLNFVKFVQFLFYFVKRTTSKTGKLVDDNLHSKNGEFVDELTKNNKLEEKTNLDKQNKNAGDLLPEKNDSENVNETENKKHDCEKRNDLKNFDEEFVRGLEQKKSDVSDESVDIDGDFNVFGSENRQDFKQNFADSDDYVFPSLGLLNKPNIKNNVDVSRELKLNATRLVDTLKSFGVETRVINISKGPAVTRYELQPSAGVKISKITNLADDISLNLAAGGVRIEAPIPNKAAVGIEVPNKIKEKVLLSEIISSNDFKCATSPLTFALGKDIAGNVVVSDIAKMPHILIAGATGSGKSVCVNSLIVSLIYKSSPKDVKLLLIDPKVVELGVYNNIAHLLIPVVTDPKKAAGALNWAVNEMLRRYKIFAKSGVRDFHSYNMMIKNDAVTRMSIENDLRESNLDSENYNQKLPQIVVVIDELADLMMAASKEVENSICRLAQMARAAGMHLVIATQRPSVDVITGLIKANVPSRIAFTVSSQIDSRTIIDVSGAEKLLGKGDMLYFPVGAQKPIRVQGCFVTDKEVERVVSSVKVASDFQNNDYGSEILEEIERHVENSKLTDSNSSNVENNFDPLFNSAVELVLESGQASTSFLQRKLKVGYSRAARIVDEMESAGVVSKANGSKARKILITRQQFLEMKMNRGK